MGPSQADCRNGQSLAELQGGRNTGDFHFAESGIRRYRYRPCPCGGTGRRARIKIVFRKEWGFDSLHGHQPSLLRSYGWPASFISFDEAARAARTEARRISRKANAPT